MNATEAKQTTALTTEPTLSHNKAGAWVNQGEQLADLHQVLLVKVVVVHSVIAHRSDHCLSMSAVAMPVTVDLIIPVLAGQPPVRALDILQRHAVARQPPLRATAARPRPRHAMFIGLRAEGSLALPVIVPQHVQP